MSRWRTVRWRWAVPLVCGVGCGILVALSLPPFGWWPLAWLGFAGLAWLLVDRRWPARLLAGAGVGLGQFVPGLWWVQEFSIPGCIALMVVSALFVVVAVACVPSGRRRGIALGLPATLVLADWLRDRFPLGGFPLGGTALGQATSPLAPSLRLGGGLLLVGVTAAAGVATAELVHLVRDHLNGRRGWRPFLSFFLVAGLTAAVPLAGYLSPDGLGGRLGVINVALVQGGGDRGTRAVDTDPQLVFDRHLAASGVLEPPLNLVVWPEGVLQSSAPFATTADAAAISALAQRLGATVLVGVEQDVGIKRYLNEVVAWDPTGRPSATYVKNHLVPFGEYVPWRSILGHFFNLADVPYDAVPGHSPGLMRSTAGPLGVMISYEVFFDQRARGGVRAGGQVLVVPTNTASYRSSQVPTQELAAARERARETGRWVLQVAPTGFTAVVAPTGHVVKRTTLSRQQVLYATVPRESGRTVYVDLGDTPVALGAVVLAGLGWGLSRRRRSTGEGVAVLEQDPEPEASFG